MITAAEYAELLSQIRNPEWNDLVVTTWETGCRPQESLRVEAHCLSYGTDQAANAMDSLFNG